MSILLPVPHSLAHQRVPISVRTCFRQTKAPLAERFLNCKSFQAHISRITGIINGLLLVLFWMYLLRSVLIFSLITP